MATLEQIAAHSHSLSIPLYVKRAKAVADKPADAPTLAEVWADWEQEGRDFWLQMDALVETLDGLVCDNDSPVR